VPATISLLGNLNWWAPAPLRRLHERIGLHEGEAEVIVLDPASPRIDATVS
jgi:RND superfamily putative drug exporter